MDQTTNEATAVQPSAKQAWATPAIETYDVAEFTLAVDGRRGDDGGSPAGNNIS